MRSSKLSEIEHIWLKQYMYVYLYLVIQFLTPDRKTFLMYLYDRIIEYFRLIKIEYYWINSEETWQKICISDFDRETHIKISRVKRSCFSNVTILISAHENQNSRKRFYNFWGRFLHAVSWLSRIFLGNNLTLFYYILWL